MNKYRTVKVKDIPTDHDKSFLREHVLIAEKKIGRKLKAGECVHHIDLNKQNNDPDNLIVFATNSDHILFHHGAEIYKDGDVWRAKPTKRTLTCLYCEKQFEITTKRKIKDHCFCSNECFKRWIQKSKATTEDLIQELYEENGNFSKVARRNGISSNAIVRRLKARKLPYHSADYRKKRRLTNRAVLRGGLRFDPGYLHHSLFVSYLDAPELTSEPQQSQAKHSAI